MNFFHDYTFKWYDTAILKLTMVLFGIYIALEWPNVFADYKTVILVLFLVGVAYLVARYWKDIFGGGSGSGGVSSNEMTQ